MLSSMQSIIRIEHNFKWYLLLSCLQMLAEFFIGVEIDTHYGGDMGKRTKTVGGLSQNLHYIKLPNSD